MVLEGTVKERERERERERVRQRTKNIVYVQGNIFLSMLVTEITTLVMEVRKTMSNNND
jgi:hypothetical protein